MAPKKKASRQKKEGVPEPSEVVVTISESTVLSSEGVFVSEGVKKLEAPLNEEHLNCLNGLPLPLPLLPPIIRPGERGLGIGNELTRPLHGSAMLEELSRMRQERFLTDMELACKSKAFDVHKLVLSSVSQYLREVLAKDPTLKRLELPTLSPLGRLATLYTGTDTVIIPHPHPTLLEEREGYVQKPEVFWAVSIEPLL